LNDEKEKQRLELWYKQQAKQKELENESELYEMKLAIEKEAEDRKLKAA